MAWSELRLLWNGSESEQDLTSAAPINYAALKPTAAVDNNGSSPDEDGCHRPRSQPTGQFEILKIFLIA